VSIGGGINMSEASPLITRLKCIIVTTVLNSRSADCVRASSA
jgi:hypothetical protein